MAKTTISIHIKDEQRISARVEETAVIHIGLNASLSQGGNRLTFSSPAGMERFRRKLAPLESKRARREQENQEYTEPEGDEAKAKKPRTGNDTRVVVGNDTRAVVEIEDEDEITLSCTTDETTVRIGPHVKVSATHQKMAELKKRIGYALMEAKSGKLHPPEDSVRGRPQPHEQDLQEKGMGTG